MTFTEIKAATWTAKQIAIVVALALVLIAGGVAVWKYRRALQQAEEALAALQEAKAVGVATKAGGEKLDAALTDRSGVDAIVATTRADARRATEELTHADPDLAAARDRPVDPRLRDIARARRAARDRPAGAASGGEGADGAAPPRR